LDQCITFDEANKPILSACRRPQIGFPTTEGILAARQHSFCSPPIVGAVIALRKNGMKTAKCTQTTQLSLALHALKDAILKGTTWQYEKLVTLAVNAGATDEQIDLVAHEAIEALFAHAERPITPRSLTQLSGAGHLRR
jgi:hypothetical protein